MKKLKWLCMVCCVAMLLGGCATDPAKQPQMPKPSATGEAAEPPMGTDEPPADAVPPSDTVLHTDGTTDTAPPIDATPPTPLVSPGELDLGDFSMAFGFADASGTRLIVNYEADDGEPDDPDYDYAGNPMQYESDPAQYTLAIGQYGEIVHVRYAGWQDETAENNYRDMSYNFDNLSGYIYNVVGGNLRPDQTYVLTTESPFIDTLIRLSPLYPDPDDPYETLEQQPLGLNTEDYIYTIKNREVQWSRLLSITGEGAVIGLVLFEREGDDMMFSIVYMDGPDSLFWDCEAKYDEYSTWRVDMGDEPGGFEPLFLARLNGKLTLMLTWSAPEGECILLLYEDNGRFIERYDYYYSRYWAPM